MRTAADIGMAGGAIALALVKYLIYNGDLSPTQAKAIMTDAQKGSLTFPIVWRPLALSGIFTRESPGRKKIFFNRPKSGSIFCDRSRLEQKLRAPPRASNTLSPARR